MPRLITHVLLVLCLVVPCAMSGCANPHIAAVKTFRGALQRKDYDSARAMMSDDPRRWWEQREGDGAPWTIGGRGRWADWDEHFRSRGEPVRWSIEGDAVTLIVRESNDYYELTERGPQLTRYVYYLDDDGRIGGLLISGDVEGAVRDPGRADEFTAWLKAEHPDEYDYLRPGGEIDPTGDRAERTRAMLERWRASAGLGSARPG